MSLVEEAYRRAVDAMTPAEKIARTWALNEFGLWHVARRIKERCGPLPAEGLKWSVALEMYGQNSDCRQLIKEQLARVHA